MPSTAKTAAALLAMPAHTQTVLLLIRTALTLLLLTLVPIAWLMLAVAAVLAVAVGTWAVATCRTLARGTATAEQEMSHGMGLVPMVKVWLVGTCQTSLGRMAADMSL